MKFLPIILSPASARTSLFIFFVHAFLILLQMDLLLNPLMILYYRRYYSGIIVGRNIDGQGIDPPNCIILEN